VNGAAVGRHRLFARLDSDALAELRRAAETAPREMQAVARGGIIFADTKGKRSCPRNDEIVT